MRARFERFLRHPRQWWWLIAFWLLLALASYAWRLNEMQGHAHELASQRGRLVFEMVETTRLWAANHGGVYAPVTEATPPNPYLDVPEKVITTPSGKVLTKINPAYMTRQLGDLIGQSWDLRIHLTSLKPINPGNVPDDWERGALEGFEQKREAKVSVVGAGGTAVFRYMAPLEVKKPCLVCHEKQGYRLGDVRGGISVTFPARHVYDIIDEHRRAYLAIHVVAFLLLSTLTWAALSLNRRHLLALESTRSDLAESEKMASLGRMVAGFAHEVNTPIGVAVGATSQASTIAAELGRLLDREEVEESELREQLALLGEGTDLALANLRRAAGMVQSFKRTAVDQESDAAREFRFAEMIDDVRKNLYNTFKKSAVDIQVSCPEDLRGYGKAGALEQVLTNLMENARIHAFDEGRSVGILRIEARPEAGHCLIAVSDNGAGMDEETAGKVFEPFFTTRRGKGGSGLGLYIVYNLVTRELGGTITCQSRPGVGTEFLVRMPLSSGKPEGTAS